MTLSLGLCCSRVQFSESRASPLQQQANPSLRTLCTTHQCGPDRWPAGFTLVRATQVSQGTVHILLNGMHEELGNNQTVLWNKCFPDGMLRCCFPVDSLPTLDSEATKDTNNILAWPLLLQSPE